MTAQLRSLALLALAAGVAAETSDSHLRGSAASTPSSARAPSAPLPVWHTECECDHSLACGCNSTRPAGPEAEAQSHLDSELLNRTQALNAWWFSRGGSQAQAGCSCVSGGECDCGSPAGAAEAADMAEALKNQTAEMSLWWVAHGWGYHGGYRHWGYGPRWGGGRCGHVRYGGCGCHWSGCHCGHVAGGGCGWYR
mmetsp:Transcript_63334/g.177211  ORF Transcript_63334/g.177211 Transcript_63334/m.177211 type:complete len:196 (+) Transcript_63334:91-678(+)